MLKDRLEIARDSSAKFVIRYTIEELKELMDDLNRANEWKKETDELANELVRSDKMKFHNHLKTLIHYNETDFVFGFFGRSFSFWGNDGLDGLVETNDFDVAFRYIDLYSSNKQECSDTNCSNTFPVGNHAGRYFAGTYCTECWENKWRAIEARETYN